MDDPAGDIEALLYDYAARIDAGDFEGIGALFAHGRIATDDGTVIAEGVDAVKSLYTATTRLHADGTPRTRHVTTNVRVRLAPDGERATAESYFTVFQQTDSVALQPVIAGSYHDEFARIDGAWRFVERRMQPALFGDLSDHLLITLTDPPTS